MNVLFLCDGYRANYSGNFIPSLRELEKRIDGRCVYLFDEGNREFDWCKKMQTTETVVEFMNFNACMTKRVMGLLKLIDAHKISIIHVHFGDRKLASICGVLRRRVRVIWHLHSDWTCGNANVSCKATLIKRVKNSILKAIGYMPDAKIAVSEKLAQMENGIYVPNGLAFERVWRMENHKQERVKMGVPTSAIAVLCFGWSPKVKGVDVAVNAIDKLRKEYHYDIRLLIVTGKDDKNVRNWLNENTSCGAEGDFIYYCAPQEDVFWYHNIADIFLSASRSEGYSYALCEAISIAKPAVCSDIPGVNWAKMYSSVQYFESGSHEKCAEAIMEVINSLEERLLLCEADSQKLKHGENNAEKWAQSVLNIYHTL